MVPMKSTTASRTVEELKKLFAQHGLREELVSDNGSQFIASELEEFMRSNGVKHTKCAPYHPASNGQVERVVQILKTVLHKHTLDKSGVSQKPAIAEFSANISNNPTCYRRSNSCRNISEKTVTHSADVIETELVERRSGQTR